MNHLETKTPRRLKAQQLLALGSTLLINAVLYLLLNGLFAINAIASSGVLS
jgi:hypothetical protein